MLVLTTSLGAEHVTKAKDYIVFCEQDMTVLEQDVNDYIKIGWQPIGGISVNNGHGDLYCQAMVRY